MIVYQATKSQFLADAFQRDIDQVICDAHFEKTRHRVSTSEVKAWKESLLSMAKVLADATIPDECGVAIEFTIPATAKRVDFIVSGYNEVKTPYLVIIELKQWTSAQLTDKDAIVLTWLGKALREVSHPSYQAWAYAALLQGFNEAVYDGSLNLQACAYLHNYVRDGTIDNAFYSHYTEKAPVFLTGDDERTKLREFIKRYVRFGDRADLIFRLENGRIRPSKMLVDSLLGMMRGKPEFVLIDDQKVVYEEAVASARRASATSKQVVIVQGGPGTGKTVVAVNLLAALLRLGLTCRYVSKNAAPRAVFEAKLTGTFRKTEISNLFSGSGVFTDAEENTFDVLIVDEAHRLNAKSGLFGNLGENQVKEIISAAKCTIFFVDDDQRVTLKDIGEEKQLRYWAAALGADTTKLKLASQFRCNGSDGYLAWIDNALQIRPTANDRLDTEGFDFRVVNSPEELHRLITKKNEENNRARVVAGYCWNWASKKQPRAYDIDLPEYGYRKRWNLTSDGSLWIVAATSVDEVGCIHTCQGLEVDYVGVIIGPDLLVREGTVVCRPEARAKSDKSLAGHRTLKRSDPVAARELADAIIKNTYRTLMTRGIRGCYIFCVDTATADYFRSKIDGRAEPDEIKKAHERVSMGPRHRRHGFISVEPKRLRKWENALPVLALKMAAGSFSQAQWLDEATIEWVEPPEGISACEGLFIAQVVGESMNRRIPNGAWCLFRMNPTGSRAGRVVIAQHRDIADPDLGGSLTVKLYSSDKSVNEDGSWKHTAIVLHPDSSDSTFTPITVSPEDDGDFRILAELVAVLH